MKIQREATGRVRGLSFNLLDLIDTASDNTLVSAIQQRGLFGDQSVVVKFEDRGVEGLPSEGRGRFDDFVERLSLGFAMFDGILDPEAVSHDFESGHAATADTG